MASCRDQLSRHICRRKPLAAFEAESRQHESASSDSDSQLSLFDLLCIGIGGTVGSGVFVLTGSVYPVAGPSAALSWMVAGVVCLLSALSYCELSVRVPSSGSTYSFAFHALGELAAVAGATSLTLEYGLSGAGVARSWSTKFADLVGCSSGLFWSYSGGHASPGGSADNYVDIGAAFIQLACVAIVLCGVSLSKRVVNVLTVAKVVLVLFLIVAGLAAMQTNVFQSSSYFFAGGASGVTRGTALLFFGFIGFDEVCCMAARCKSPRYAMPRAIVGTLLGAAALSTAAQLALAGMVEHNHDDDDDDGTSFEREFRLKGWRWAKYVAQVGEVSLLPLVVLLSFLPQPELMAALGADGLVSPSFARLGGRRGDVYVFGCLTCGVLLTVVSLIVPFDILWNMINLGVLIGFNLSNASLISARLGNAGACVDPAADGVLKRFACLYAPAAAYFLWKGVAEPILNGRRRLSQSRLSFLALGVFGLVAGLASLATLNSKLAFSAAVAPADFDGHAPVGFRAPCVPWLPGLAIFLNFVLMAQFDWIDHAYLAVLYGAAYVCFFYTKLSGRFTAKYSSDSQFGIGGDESVTSLRSPLLVSSGGQQDASLT